MADAVTAPHETDNVVCACANGLTPKEHTALSELFTVKNDRLDRAAHPKTTFITGEKQCQYSTIWESATQKQKKLNHQSIKGI